MSQRVFPKLYKVSNGANKTYTEKSKEEEQKKFKKKEFLPVV